MLIGYARVSSVRQETHLQISALKVAGCVKIYREKASSVGARPVLQKLIGSLRAGQVRVVYELEHVVAVFNDSLLALAVFSLSLSESGFVCRCCVFWFFEIGGLYG